MQTPVVRLGALVKRAVFDRMPNVLRRGPRDHRRIAITFDAGPDAETPLLLDTLDRLAIPATFFLVGAQVVARPGLVRDYVRRGHQVAGHGFDRTPFRSLDRRTLLAQCRRTEDALGGQLTGRPWVRPPDVPLDAAVDTRSVMALLAAGYTIALASLDSLDHDGADPAAIAARCAPERVGPGEVLVFRESRAATRAALPGIVGALRDAGYECVTMFDLFAA